VQAVVAWSLSEEEESVLREQFLSLDSSNTGTITLQDFRSALSQMFGVEGHNAEELFGFLDTNCDGELDYTEFLAAASSSQGALCEAHLHEAFARFDANGDGKVDDEDLMHALGAPRSEVNLVMREADTSGDGCLDYGEFAAYFHKPSPSFELQALTGPAAFESSVARPSVRRERSPSPEKICLPSLLRGGLCIFSRKKQSV